MKKDIILHSEEMDEMIVASPRHIVKWGETVIGLVLLILIIGCFIFKYPDTITCRVTVATQHPAVWIVSQATGKIKDLLCKDGEIVYPGKIVAVVDNSAKTSDVLDIEKELRKSMWGIKFKVSNENLELGELQGSYADFISSLSDYRQFLDNNLYLQKINAGKEQQQVYVALIKNMQRQASIKHEQSLLSKDDFKSDEILYRKGLLAKTEYTKAKIEQLGNSLSAEQNKSSILNSQLQVTQIANDIIELKMQFRQDSLKVSNSLKAAYNKLQTDIRNWKNTYAIVCPIYGKLAFGKYWALNQNVTTGDKMFSIIPTNSDQQVIAKATVSVVGAGKIHYGQQANIMLDDYPYMEYGYLKGKILNISQIPEDENYIATIRIAYPKVTSYHKHVDIQGEHSGTAEILTDERSLGERIVAPIFYLLKHNF